MWTTPCPDCEPVEISRKELAALRAELAEARAERDRLIEAWPVYCDGGGDINGVLYEQDGYWWAEHANSVGFDTRAEAIRHYIVGKVTP